MDPQFFSYILPLLDVRNCCKLSFYAILWKTNETKLEKIAKKYIYIFKNLALSVTRYNDQLSPCTTSEKTNDPILRKLSDGQIDRRTRVIS